MGSGAPKCIGPERGFGVVLGDRQPQAVLLVKAAWGGKSLYRDFRPPSAELPPRQALDRMLADLTKRKSDATEADVSAPFGASYPAILKEFCRTVKVAGTCHPVRETGSWI
ncbi:MAG: hypothetical protein U0804_07720 [Gemmataceae bacterium]